MKQFSDMEIVIFTTKYIKLSTDDIHLKISKLLCRKKESVANRRKCCRYTNKKTKGFVVFAYICICSFLALYCVAKCSS